VGPCQGGGGGGGGAFSLSAEWGLALSSEPLVLCGFQREEAPQSGRLKLLLGVDPKAAIEGRLGKEEAEGVGLLIIQSFGEQKKSGSRAERRKRGAAVKGIFLGWLGHPVEANSRLYCAVETAHTQGHIQQEQ
jgi:hypothetical protein